MNINITDSIIGGMGFSKPNDAQLYRIESHVSAALWGGETLHQAIAGACLAEGLGKFKPLEPGLLAGPGLGEQEYIEVVISKLLEVGDAGAADYIQGMLDDHLEGVYVADPFLGDVGRNRFSLEVLLEYACSELEWYCPPNGAYVVTILEGKGLGVWGWEDISE